MFHSAGLNPDAFIITNDTPLTLKATDGAQSGMVLSTGVNGTIFTEELGICNGEIGTRFLLTESMISESDLVSRKRTPIKPINLEHLTAGKFLPQLFAGYIASSRSPDLSELTSYLRDQESRGLHYFKAEDLTSIIDNNFDAFSARIQGISKLTSKAFEELHQTAKGIVSRSAKLGALLALCSLKPSFEISESPLLALDSTLSRHIPGYLGTFSQTLRELSQTHSKEVTIRLLEPLSLKAEEISVPTVGALRSLQSLLSS